MKLEGSLDAFSLPDVFALLSMTKKTGGLHLQREGARGVLFFTTGSLTGGSPDVARQVLARRLVGAGHVDDEALTAAVATCQGDPDVGVVRALQQSGAVDEGTVHEVLTEHLVDTVFDLLRWPDGSFAFEMDQANPDDVGVLQSPEDAVTEARRRLEDWSKVAETVPSPSTVLTVALAPASEPALSREEWALLALVDGHRTVAEIVGLTGRGDYAVVSRLADLVTRGLLRAGETDGVAAMLRRQSALAVLEDVPAAAPKPRSSKSHEVTPERPEPFRAPRRLEHPDSDEPVTALVGAVNGANAMVPDQLSSNGQPSSLERDPSVNKSMLLRLIAGVRGL